MEETNGTNLKKGIMAVTFLAENIITSLGFSVQENMEAIYAEKCGIVPQPGLFEIPEAFQASAVSTTRLNESFDALEASGVYTRFEKLLILSIQRAILASGIDPSSTDTLFVFSTTKGNVALLEPTLAEHFPKERVELWAAAREISRFFRNPNTPVVISQACVTGVSVILLAKMYLEAKQYKHVIVVGGDILSKFVVSGFQSFKALSSQPCRPFDANRDGLSLGEGAGTLILGVRENDQLKSGDITVEAGATSNDANHISGPSRTGEGLFQAIMKTVRGLDIRDISFINAHGTATPYNDEMEAIAFSRAGLESIPVNSLKGYLGHTLGAAGLIESVISANALRQERLIRCLGYTQSGVSANIRIIDQQQESQAPYCLKTASGFGGCNAVVLLKVHKG